MTWFKSKTAAIEHFRKYLHESPEWHPITGHAFDELCELINLHPSAKDKIGCGIEAIYVRPNPVFRSQKSFWIRRVDGSETDFSYLRCIDGKDKSNHHWFRQACRWAVAEQIIAFKMSAFDAGAVVCVVTGESVGWNDCHVDHHDPQFAVLVDQFINQIGIDVGSVSFLKDSDGECSVVFADDSIRGQWCEYHKENATLRIVKTSVNLRRKRNGR